MASFPVHVLLAILVKGMTLLAGFALIAAVTTWLPARDASVFFLFQSISTSLAVLSCFGLETYLLKLFSSEGLPERKTRFVVYISALRIVLFISSICVIVGTVGSFYRPIAVDLVADISYFATIPFLAILILSSEALRGLGFYYRAATLLGILPPILTGSLLILFAEYGLASGITFATSLLIGYLFPGWLGVVSVYKHVSHGKKNFSSDDRKQKLIKMERAFSYFCTTGIQQVLTFIPVIIAGLMQISDDFSSYYVALRVSVIASFVLASLNIFAAPVLSNLFASSNLTDFKLFTNLVAAIAFWSTVLLSLFCFVLGDYILNILGGSLKGGFTYLLILLIGHVVSSAVGSVVYVLIMSDNERDVRDLYLVALVLTLVISPFTIIKFGVYGAVMVNLLVMILVNIGAWCAVYYRLGFLIVPFVNISQLIIIARKFPTISHGRRSNE